MVVRQCSPPRSLATNLNRRGREYNAPDIRDFITQNPRSSMTMDNRLHFSTRALFYPQAISDWSIGSPGSNDFKTDGDDRKISFGAPDTLGVPPQTDQKNWKNLRWTGWGGQASEIFRFQKIPFCQKFRKLQKTYSQNTSNTSKSTSFSGGTSRNTLSHRPHSPPLPRILLLFSRIEQISTDRPPVCHLWDQNPRGTSGFGLSFGCFQRPAREKRLNFSQFLTKWIFRF